MLLASIGGSIVPRAAATARAADYSAAILATPGLQDYYQLDERSGPTVHDARGGRNGSLSGGVSLGVPGAVDGGSEPAMSFNGTSGEATIPHGDAGVSGAVTIEGWAAVRGSGHTQHLFGWRNYVTADFYIDQLASGQLEARFTNSAHQSYTIDTAAPGGGWHSFALSYNGSSTLALFIDGRLRASTPASGHLIDDGGQPLMIGGGNGGNFLNGSVDEVAVYDTALPAATIAQHEQAGLAGAKRSAAPSPAPKATATPRPTASPTPKNTPQLAPTTPAANTGSPSLTLAPPSGGYAAVILGTAGLQDYYPLAETAGSTAHDVKSGRNGSIQGGVQLGVAGAPVGTLAMRFNGINGQVLIPNGDAGVTGAATIEGWVDASPSSTTEHYFGWRNYTSADFYIDRLNSNLLEARLTTSTGRAYTLSNVPAPQTGWHLLALTYDGASRLTLYVDGVARASITASGHLLDDGRQANMIGGGQGGNFLPGSVAAVAVYNVALSASQIASHFHAAAIPSRPSAATPPPVPAPVTSSVAPHPGSLPAHWLGVMANGYPGSSAQPLTDFITATGLRPAVVESFQNWTDASGFYSSQLDMTRGFGALPLVTWGPNDTLAHIIDGSHDAYVRQWAQQAKDYGHPFMLRFAHEMNGDWYPWGFAYGHNGNTPQQFIQAWRHVHDIFSQVGASNVIWVWSPNARWGPPDSFASFYPGDAYVDWIAFDTYNWGNTGTTTWTSFINTYKPSYDEITRLTNKPLMIAEGAAADVPNAPYATAKADWIRQGFLTDVPNVMPRLRGFVWFNADKERDWRVNSSASALAAFRAVAQSTFWK